MPIRETVLSGIQEVMDAVELPDVLERDLLRMQEIVDKTHKFEIEYIQRLSNTYYGRKLLTEEYTLKWFNESLFSQDVLSIILQELISALNSSGDNSLPIPKVWSKMYNGESTAISFDSERRAVEALQSRSEENREEQLQDAA